MLDFITVGGNALRAYDDYHRVRCEEGVYRIASKKAAWQHRLNIGTITSDASLQVQFLKGGKLGFIEESFASRLAPGDNFTFAGRSLELVAIRDMKVYVRKSKAKDGPIPRWMGGRMPLSTELAEAVRAKLQEANEGQWHGVELKAVRPVLELQSERSRIPDRDDLLIEHWKSREGHHLYLFPFAGRLVHEGLAALIAYRLSRRSPISFALTVNDYGMELLSNVEVDVERAAEQGLFSPDGLVEDVLSALNSVEMSRRHFREIARVAGLVTQGSPAQRKSTKQLQASAGLLFDVFTTYDADNRLLHQAKREVLERELEIERLQMTLQRMQSSKWQFVTTTRPTPLAFPLLVDRLRERLSSENLLERIRKMQIQS